MILSCWNGGDKTENREGVNAMSNLELGINDTSLQDEYICFEVHYPADHPQSHGKYFGKTPIFEQALKAAQAIGGALYGITTAGVRIFILY